MNDSIHTFIIELSSRCNEGCKFCYSISWDANTRKPKKKELNISDWKIALQNIKKAGAYAVNFSGGEPTFHKDFVDLIEFSKKLGFYVIVSTNGSTITSPKIKNSLERHANCIALSIHGPREIHDKVKMRMDSFTNVIGSYHYYLRKDKNVKVNSVACKENYDSLIELGKILNIENNKKVHWKISQVIPRGAGLINKQAIVISDTQFEILQKKVAKRYPLAHHEKRLTFREDDSKLHKHPFVPYILVVSDGDIYVSIGEDDVNLNFSVLDKDILGNVKKKLANHQEFLKALKDNHYKYYGMHSESDRISEEHGV